MWIDVFFVISVGLGFYWGFQKGLIYALISWIGLYLAGILSLRFAGMAAEHMGMLAEMSPQVRLWLAAILLFFFLLFSVRLLIFILEQILKSFALTTPNKIAGGFIYAFTAVFLYSIILRQTSGFAPQQAQKSHVFAWISPLAPVILEKSSSVFPLAGQALAVADSIASGALITVDEHLDP